MDMRVLLSFGGGISRSVFTAKTLPGQKAPMTRRTQRKGLSKERKEERRKRSEGMVLSG